MMRIEGPAVRRMQQRAAQRRRWELALLALAVGHWAYHKNREWNLAVKDLIAARGEGLSIDVPDYAEAFATVPSHDIDLTSAEVASAFPVPADR